MNHSLFLLDAATAMQLTRIAIMLMLAICPFAADSKDLEPTDIEAVVTCERSAWIFTEARVLKSWALISRGHDTETLRAFIGELEASKKIEPYSILSADGRTIGGRRATFGSKKSNTAVLVAAGNVSTADVLLQHLLPVAKKTEYDFYFIDYRGYGLSSQAIPSFRALVSDFAAIKLDLKSRGYERIIGYGPSLGGTILLNAATTGPKFDRLVIDSVQAKLDNYECDESVYPIVVAPYSCPNLIALSSINDKEVSTRRQAELLNFIRSPNCGGRVTILTTAIHALNDEPNSPGDEERMNAIIDALTR